ncbi:ABC transporter G family member 23 isoform X1 [Actinidia eriantha]|uniref:ABC transporter G family member 23 isoform X1 n=1 Tax=Actinidia eriantha TaxID=165200 RepID=UPI0025838E71|nr:ABC transporter G family member 23 isoform X1 [Actinidia eriantha]
MASCFQKPNVADDSTVLFSSSDSPEESISHSSSSVHHSPPPPYQSKTAYKLSVRNLSYTIHQNRTISTLFCRPEPKPLNILKSVSFVARSSEILAIVGPSGTGKSSLLRLISGRVREKDFDRKSVSLNDYAITSPTQLRKKCGFVAQEDNLLPLLTVKETLMFSAKFRLKEMSAEEREERVESLMQELGLVHVADSFVGDEENRGISGGERKRVSIGVDMIHDPPILLLDEPTSGLDSTSALQVIELLSSMAILKRRTIVVSIHQPSYRILQYISNFLILSHGSVVHNGGLGSLEETINELGFKIPVQLNALEFSMEIISTLEEYSNSKVYLPEMEDKEPQPYLTCQEDYTSDASYFQSLFEISILCERFWKIIYRTKQLFLARTMQALVGGFGLGSVYIKVKNDEGGVAERLGLFAFSLSFLLSSTVEALPIYLQERRVLMKEASRGAYRISSYMIANTIVFLPFLFAVAILFAVPVYWLVGLNPSIAAFAFFTLVVWIIVLMASSLVLFLSAISPDFISGNSLICTVLGAFFLFSGYFIPKDCIPKYWLFMYYVSLYRYPLDSLLVNEYWSLRGACFKTLLDHYDDDQHQFIHSQCLLTGNDVLKSRGLDKGDTRWFNVGIMFGFFVFYRVLCWIILVRRVSKTTI